MTLAVSLALTYTYGRASQRCASTYCTPLLTLGIRSPAIELQWWPKPGPEFAACFFGAVYAGAWPVPLPLADQLRRPRCLCRSDCRSAEELRQRRYFCSRMSCLTSAASLQIRPKSHRAHGRLWRASSFTDQIFRPLLPTTSLTFNIQADRRVFRTASRATLLSASGQPLRPRRRPQGRGEGPLHFVAALVP